LAGRGGCKIQVYEGGRREKRHEIRHKCNVYTNDFLNGKKLNTDHFVIGCGNGSREITDCVRPQFAP